ncbi:Bug family tripartite tricarboxylate transporter substrate binding protein [Citreimonas salinaria]|uniref:Tripartite-type tricarboxylate transporter, receptor component TctC n=1 Tax=Citreimonas salinaria TaxID=321339 RepID=A0A1H3NH17_9RHOB|nr:tripartite tricarboxylate transporter substrate binding protein [Citreimonas salinaria]SDY88043.1 Tripartite-type tricarboxylate transporter, receptor component TctC [Citreimonas salinaria]
MKFNVTGAFGATVLALVGSAALADYPERQIDMIIPYGPGGATDISARAIAEPLSTAVGRPLIMTNRAGAGGAIGSVAVQNAAPDGYKMLFARVGSHTVSPAMKETLPYGLEDFRFVGVYEINPVACAVAANSDIQSMDDLVAKIEAEPGSVRFSSSGVGTLLHIAGAMVLSEFGVENPLEDAVHIPLGGGGEAATAVLNGTATFVCTNTSALANFVANGQLRPLMVTTAEPVEGFDAPTSADLGKPALEQLVGWTGIAGPADLPDDIADAWAGWLGEAVQNDKFRDQMETMGSVIRLMPPEESQEFINNQYEVFRNLVEELDMRVEG